jgi:hypothetical protein
MKLSEAISKMQQLLEANGDIDLLENENFPVRDIIARVPSKGELEYWGCDPNDKTPIAQIIADN